MLGNAKGLVCLFGFFFIFLKSMKSAVEGTPCGIKTESICKLGSLCANNHLRTRGLSH